MLLICGFAVDFNFFRKFANVCGKKSVRKFANQIFKSAICKLADRFVEVPSTVKHRDAKESKRFADLLDKTFVILQYLRYLNSLNSLDTPIQFVQKSL